MNLDIRQEDRHNQHHKNERSACSRGYCSPTKNTDLHRLAKNHEDSADAAEVPGLNSGGMP